MRVSLILDEKGGDIVTASPEQNLAEAAAILAQHRIGAILVSTADEAVAGILSERDIVRAVARRGAGALDETIERHMTKSVITCKPEDSITEIMQTMTDNRFRHLPVLDGGRVCGIISIGDVVKHRISEVEEEAREMRSYISHA